MKQMKMNVEGMTCGHCVRHVTEALEELDGVTKVEVSLEDKHATFEVGDDFSLEFARGAVEEAGYTPGEIS